MPSGVQRRPVRGAVSLADGVRIQTDGDDFVADASTPGPDTVPICSHAHGDHLPTDPTVPAVCSRLTAALAGVRRDRPLEIRDHPAVDLLPAGHVAGSRAGLIDDGDTRYCYTGDVCTRDRCYLEGFEPPDADVLIVEATYGRPDYVFPDHETVEREIREWLAETMDRPVICFGYALGRAQKLEYLLERSDRTRVLVSDVIADLNEPIAEHAGVTFDVQRFAEVRSGDGPDLEPGDALVMPSQVSGMEWIDDLVERTEALQAGFSGWAVDRSYRFRGGFDATFPLSDHCDFEELLGLVEAVDPDAVYTQHGFADQLAAELDRRGYDARSLKRNQATLGEF